MTEPFLFHFHRLTISRDHKIVVIISLFVGALSGWAILDNVESGGTRCWYANAISYCRLVVKSLGEVFLVAVDERTDTPETNSG